MRARLVRRLAHTSSDEGAALLLALIFVGVVAVLVTALLPYAQSGISEASVARDVRSTQNAVDGAVQGAIQQVRPSLSYGSSGGPCPQYAAPTYTTAVGSTTTDTDVTVVCQLAPGVTPTAPDVPPYAIVTTTGGIDATGNSPLAIDGGVYASGNVTVPNGQPKMQYVVTGDAYTRNGGTCSAVFATGEVACPANPPTDDPAFPSIDYESALGPDAASATAAIAALPADPLGDCPAGADYVQFKPGYYSQIPTPDPASCGNNPPDNYWFAPCADPSTGCPGQTSPGVYYLDFGDASYANYTSGKAVWDLDHDNISLLGGSAPTNWPSLDPGQRCDRSADAVGVQVILGGPTELFTGTHAAVELCASKTSVTSAQRIALYGLSSNPDYGYGIAGGNRPVAGPDTVSAAHVGDTAAPDVAWQNPPGAQTPGDASIATATFDGTAQSKTYGLDLSDFNSSVPDGSLITSAVIRVSHAELATQGKISPAITVTTKSGAAQSCSIDATGTDPDNAPLVTSEIDLINKNQSTADAKCDANALGTSGFWWRELKGLHVTYEAAGSKSGNKNPSGAAAVDGIELIVKYVKPALEAQRCPDGQTAPCYSFSNSFSDANEDTFFIGTVFSPDLPLHVLVHNNPETIFQRGVVASALDVKVSQSSKQSDSPFQLPHSASVDRTVLFTAYLTADATKKPLLRARVRYVDCTPTPQCVQTPNAPGNQVRPGKKVVVQEWTTLR